MDELLLQCQYMAGLYEQLDDLAVAKKLSEYYCFNDRTCHRAESAFSISMNVCFDSCLDLVKSVRSSSKP